MAPRKRVRGHTLFVTVGSTTFDKLKKRVLSDEFVDKLVELGFTLMIIQAGRYTFQDDEDVDGLSQKIDIEAYEYQKSIIGDMKRADLIIGHAGAGTCLEALRMNKRLLLVVNEDLMDNHQRELADELAKTKYVAKTTVDSLIQDFEIIHEAKLEKFPAKDPTKFERIFEEALKKINRT